MSLTSPSSSCPSLKAECEAYRSTRWHRHLWNSDLTPCPSDGAIKAYKAFPWAPPKKRNSGLQGAESRSGSPPSQVWGARRGARAQPGRPRKYPHHWGSTNWPQTPPGWEGGVKKWGERKKWDGVDYWESCRNFTIYNDGNVPESEGWEPVLLKCIQTGVHVWLVPFSTTKDP